MPEDEPLELRVNHSILRLREPVGPRERLLPSPVIYLGLISLSGSSTDTMSSDAFKRRVADTEGQEHTITLYTLETLYEEVAGSERNELHQRHWSHLEPGED